MGGRKPTLSGSELIVRHKDVITICDVFTAEVFAPTGLVTFYVRFFIQVGSRKVYISGVTPHGGRGFGDAPWVSRS